jgi:hypothetical protein
LRCGDLATRDGRLQFGVGLRETIAYDTRIDAHHQGAFLDQIARLDLDIENFTRRFRFDFDGCERLDDPSRAHCYFQRTALGSRRVVNKGRIFLFGASTQQHDWKNGQ